jgi:predicted enzyme related to lactoylglutathione lyase
MEVVELPGIGWMSMIIDPTGSALALWKPASARNLKMRMRT